MPDTGAPYFIPFAEPTDLVRDWPDLSEDVALAIVAALENIPVTEKRIEAFTGSGNWTVPAGVTYAIAHMIGGGGGIAGGTARNAGNGAVSSVDFASGLVSSAGGVNGYVRGATASAVAGQANSGRGANVGFTASENSGSGRGNDAQWVVAGAPVTPAATVAVVVGAGGTAGSPGAAGATGYVYIEYMEEI